MTMWTMSTSREVDNETKAGVISRFFEVIENDLQFLTMQLKKATKLEMKVFRDKKSFNTRFAHMSSVLS